MTARAGNCLRIAYSETAVTGDFDSDQAMLTQRLRKLDCQELLQILEKGTYVWINADYTT